MPLRGRPKVLVNYLGGLMCSEIRLLDGGGVSGMLSLGQQPSGEKLLYSQG